MNNCPQCGNETLNDGLCDSCALSLEDALQEFEKLMDFE
jgi:hypothetical protein